MALIRGTDLLLLNKAEEKMNKGEALTPDERAMVTAHPEWLKKNMVKHCGHKGCTNELEPRIDGERHKIGGKEVCDDCYYNELGDELEKYPILPPRLRRRA